ncbi:hypothetical protein ACLSU7_13455 [Bdellovibrio sp. HCB185ZH]|uniref:hypothetical protein n=1 Tax=Bdellovibrio sp. HCB185ZH TaxID=3394235 RepID=UPI0039A74959
MKFTATALFAATVLTYNIANAGITCSSTECKAEDMPLLDQMESSVKAKFGSMACLPTSSTMVMESIFNTKKDIVAGSFTESLYQQGSYGAVVMLGIDMKTTSANGTYVNDANKTFAKIAQGFSSGATGFSFQNSQKSLTPANLLAEMQGGSLGSILFASYIPKCSSMASGRQTCSFTRQYGHSVAVQGASASSVSIYDPNDEKWSSQLLKLADDSSFSGATLSLPSHIGADARILDKNYYTQGEVDLAEYFYGLKTSSGASTPVVTQPTPAPSPVVTQPTPAPSPVVTQPTPAPSPVVTQPKPSPSPVVTTPKPSQTWQQWVQYYRNKGKFASRR